MKRGTSYLKVCHHPKTIKEIKSVVKEPACFLALSK
jgi:hypothetical protein